MKTEKLKEIARRLPDGLEILIRCQWEGDQPNGNCFQLGSIIRDRDHGTGEEFIAFECDQGEEGAGRVNLNETELIELLREETVALEEHDFKIPMTFHSSSALMLIGNLQLALRHPGNNGASAQTAREIIDAVKEQFERICCAAHVEIIKRGDDPEHDQPRGAGA